MTETTPRPDDGARRAVDTAASRPAIRAATFVSQDRNASQNPPSPGIYAVKLWPADLQHPEQLRGRLEHVFSGRCHDFADGASLLSFLLMERRQQALLPAGCAE